MNLTRPEIIETVHAAAAAGELLNYAVAGRTLTGVRYCQTASTFWLWLEFDGWCDLLVVPQAAPTRERPVPWFEFWGVPDAQGLTDPDLVPFPRHLDAVIAAGSPPNPPSGNELIDPASAQAAATAATTLEGRHAHGALSDATFDVIDGAARRFQIEFDEGWFLAFDFNPPGQRRHQSEWIALFDDAPETDGDDDDWDGGWSERRR